MAMKTDMKLYVAAGVLAVLGGGLYLQKQSQKREEAAYTYDAVTANLPKISLTEEQTKAVDSITIQQPPGDGKKPAKVVLTKKGDDWMLTEPLTAKANKSSVESLVDNLKELKVPELISSSKESYAQYDLTDEKSVHVTVKQGDKVVANLYFGQGGSRGQMMRIDGKEGVYAVKGYSSYLYAKELKGFRDLTVTKFEDDKVKTVSIENEHGQFEFVNTTEKKPEADKKDDKDAPPPSTPASWSGKFKKAKGGALANIERFDPSKVADLVRAFKSLTALDFAVNRGPVDLGFDKPVATITIVMEDGAHKIIRLGKPGESSDRWVQLEGTSDYFTIANYTADWVTGDLEKYQKPDEKKKKDDKKGGDSAPSMPPGMHGGMGMPPGMGQ